jgi:hypothetical protein
MTTPELHAADPALRRLASWLLPLVVLAGGGAMLLLFAWLGSEDATATLDAMLFAFAGLAVVVATASLTLGWTLWREAGVIDAEKRYPASDMRTLSDVRVLHGDAARQRARWMRAAALLSALFALGLVAWALWSIRALQ